MAEPMPVSGRTGLKITGLCLVAGAVAPFTGKKGWKGFKREVVGRFGDQVLVIAQYSARDTEFHAVKENKPLAVYLSSLDSSRKEAMGVCVGE